ncbi:hypothetical protein AB0H97_38330, partial [Streptomyces sp. NPDC050788]|uniref:hypothetical protein n=1 Tax=Streptomyces sp. NPDC050788 TaxID=3155041 RepID=UPI003418042D
LAREFADVAEGDGRAGFNVPAPSPCTGATSGAVRRIREGIHDQSPDNLIKGKFRRQCLWGITSFGFCDVMSIIC